MRVATKLSLDLGVARTKTLITRAIHSVYVLDKGLGDFILIFQFLEQKDLKPLTLDQDDVHDGMELEWNILKLLMTNTAQAGKTLDLIIEKEV